MSIKYNKYVPSLQAVLQSKKINVEIDVSNEPLTEVACKYHAVVGMPSLGLRDVVLMCEDKTKVICFEELSKKRYYFPRGVIFEKEVLWLDKKNQISKVSNRLEMKKINYISLNDIFNLIDKDQKIS